MLPTPAQPHFSIAIACGGTGGHLYPGMAVGERLRERGASVTLVVSAKEVDQQALRGDDRFDLLTVPAVGFAWRKAGAFGLAFLRSYRLARAEFSRHPIQGLLAMGGFTSLPSAYAAHRLGVPVYLHEANAVPGRANRWLARVARTAFVYFPEAEGRLRARQVRLIGMPVRQEFQPLDSASCRMALGLDPTRPVLLVMGGSQGASGINEALLASLPALVERIPTLQFLHLSGSRDEERVRLAYQASGARAVVRAFLTEMDLALGAADAAVTRAGASSAAELAAVGLPALMIPYPHASEGHQEANARALERSGAVCVLRQVEAVPEHLVPLVERLLGEGPFRAVLRAGLAAWHHPGADGHLAEAVLAGVTGHGPVPSSLPGQAAPRPLAA